MNSITFHRKNQSDSQWIHKNRQQNQAEEAQINNTNKYILSKEILNNYNKKDEEKQKNILLFDDVNNNQNKNAPNQITQRIQNPNLPPINKCLPLINKDQQIKTQNHKKYLKSQVDFSIQGQNDYQLDLKCQNMSKNETKNNNQTFQQIQNYQNNNNDNIKVQQQEQQQKQSYPQIKKQTTPQHNYQYPQQEEKQPNIPSVQKDISQNNNEPHLNQQQFCQLKYDNIQEQKEKIWQQIMEKTNQNIDQAYQRFLNVLFYAGINKSNQRMSYNIDQLHQRFGNYEILESDQQSLHWLFPNKFKSNLKSDSKPLNDDEISIFLKEPFIAENYIKSYEMMLDFYGMKIINKATGELSRNHNYQDRYKKSYSIKNIRRIRRILTSLSNLGFRKYAIQLSNFIKKETTQGDRPLQNLSYYYQSELQFYEERIDGSYEILERNCFQTKEQIDRENIFFLQFQENRQIIENVNSKPLTKDQKPIYNVEKEINIIHKKQQTLFQKFCHFFVCNSDIKQPSFSKQKKKTNLNKEQIYNKTKQYQYNIQLEQQKILDKAFEVSTQKNLPESHFQNVLFYAGIYESNHFKQSIQSCVHVKIDQMHSWFKNYKQLEDESSYIQCIFPNKFPLNEEEIQMFLEVPFLADRYIKSYEMMLDFYGMKMVDKKTGRLERNSNYLSRYDEAVNGHNITRIRRILTSLHNMGFKRYAFELCDTLCKEIYQNNRPLMQIEQDYKNELKFYEQRQDNNYAILEQNCFQNINQLNRENIFLKNVDKT